MTQTIENRSVKVTTPRQTAIADALEFLKVEAIENLRMGAWIGAWWGWWWAA